MTRDEFLARLAITYGQPDTADEALFIENYEAVIGMTAPRVLDVAFSIIRDEHEYKTWPMPAVVRKAIASAALRVNGPPRHGDRSTNASANPIANPNAESRARVAALVASMVKEIGADAKLGPKKISGVSRPDFEAMQRNSPNRHMHVEPKSLTERSKRMQGTD